MNNDPRDDDGDHIAAHLVIGIVIILVLFALAAGAGWLALAVLLK